MGVYPIGSLQTLRAIPNSDYHFSHWSDGDESNPRTLEVWESMSLTAYFEKGAASIDATGKAVPFTVHPNPSHGMAVVELDVDEDATLRVIDATGKEVSQYTVSAGDYRVELDLSHLAAGVYYVTLDTPDASATQKLILK